MGKDIGRGDGHTVFKLFVTLYNSQGSQCNIVLCNLLLDVSFNREVAQEAALYWSKEEGSLAKCIDQAERMSLADMEALEQKAKNRIKTAYSWQFICGEYARLFTGEK